MLINTDSMRRARGFTLIELVIAVTVFSILVLTAVPTMASWVAGAQVRTVANGLENGLHLAQAEASRRNRTIKFILTDDDVSTGTSWTASATGKNWVVATTPRLKLDTGSTETAERIAGATVANTAGTVTVSGPATLTFNSYGMVTGASGTSTYQVRRTGADHPLNVTVAVGGSIRSCDSSKTLAASPEGC